MDMRRIYTRQIFIWQGGWSHFAPLPSLVIAPQHPPLSSLPLLASSTITITIAHALLCHRNPAPSTIAVIATWHFIVQHLHYMKTSLIEIWWRSYFKEYEKSSVFIQKNEIQQSKSYKSQEEDLLTQRRKDIFKALWQ